MANNIHCWEKIKTKSDKLMTTVVIPSLGRVISLCNHATLIRHLDLLQTYRELTLNHHNRFRPRRRARPRKKWRPDKRPAKLFPGNASETFSANSCRMLQPNVPAPGIVLGNHDPNPSHRRPHHVRTGVTTHTHTRRRVEQSEKDCQHRTTRCHRGV